MGVIQPNGIGEVGSGEKGPQVFGMLFSAFPEIFRLFNQGHILFSSKMRDALNDSFALSICAALKGSLVSRPIKASFASQRLPQSENVATVPRDSGALSPFELVETMQVFVPQKARQF